MIESIIATVAFVSAFLVMTRTGGSSETEKYNVSFGKGKETGTCRIRTNYGTVLLDYENAGRKGDRTSYIDRTGSRHSAMSDKALETMDHQIRQIMKSKGNLKGKVSEARHYAENPQFKMDLTEQAKSYKDKFG